MRFVATSFEPDPRTDDYFHYPSIRFGKCEYFAREQSCRAGSCQSRFGPAALCTGQDAGHRRGPHPAPSPRFWRSTGRKVLIARARLRVPQKAVVSRHLVGLLLQSPRCARAQRLLRLGSFPPFLNSKRSDCRLYHYSNRRFPKTSGSHFGAAALYLVLSSRRLTVFSPGRQ